MTIRITRREMYEKFFSILQKNGFNRNKAEILANIFTDNSIDGVYTHGVNRFARFILYVNEKCIDINGEPELKHSTGAFEQWDGNLGAGPLNALHSTNRSIELSRQFGIGCVGLANTNHWMRGGTYGGHAAKNGCAFIGWTNTLALMPTWNAINPKLGNNPIVFASPYNDEAIVLDMAMSQFSVGKLETGKRRNQELSHYGGYDENGTMTKDAAAILKTKRILPMGLWKGAGLALLIDILATVFSSGLSTEEINKFKYEHSLSQVFISIDLSRLGNASTIKQTINNIIADYKTSIPEFENAEILYPGERVLNTRNENRKNGIPVDEEIWNEIQNL